MSIIAELLRAHTLPGLKDVTNVPRLTFKGWLAQKSFKVSSPLESKSFVLDVYSHNELVKSFAYDINRMATSAFESMHGIAPENKLPKSTGWLIIRCYYSAYFAMQAILRLFGISCSQFDNNEARAITEVANTYSLQNGKTTATGYYRCRYISTDSTVNCKQLSNTHQDVWKVFFELLNDLSDKVVNSDFLKKDRDEVLDFIFNLRDGLSCRGKTNGGNWLSKVRNEVNYTHSMGAWYPYSDSINEYENMFRLTANWKSKPTHETINHHLNSCDQLLYVSTCVTIVSLCHALIEDLYATSDSTFLKYGAIRLVKQI